MADPPAGQPAERFLAEIETTANLQHPHILPLFDSGEADSFLFYVMPYVEGETLRDRIDREKQLPVDEALGIATAVAGALQTAHEQGVIHRDIKPGNILLSRGQPLVADFGIAIAVSAGGGGRLTETGLSLGTPYYMSPEQATGDQAVGPASDTFALACVLYEMLVGEPPYPGTTAQAVLGKIIQGVPVSATAVRQSVPANVDAAIRKALEKLPADRFTGAAQFARALAHGPRGRLAAPGIRPVGELRRPGCLLRPVAPGYRFVPSDIFARQVLSPDDTRIAFNSTVAGNEDVYVKHLPDGPEERITFDEAADFGPFWARDGESLTYLSGTYDVWSVHADGTRDPLLVLDDERSIGWGSWSPDAEFLLLQSAAPPSDILAFRPRSDTMAFPLLSTLEFSEGRPSLSPDGRWLAYTTNETGRSEVSLRPFPNVDSTRVRASIDGGYEPFWAKNGHELFFLDPDGGLVSVRVDAGSGEVLERAALFTLPEGYFSTGNVTTDGERFLMRRQVESATQTTLVLVQNFFEELKRVAPN